MWMLTMWTAAFSAELVFEVTGLRSDDGSVVALLFSDDQGFPNDPTRARAAASVPIRDRRATVRFAELPEGTYAVGFLHDENGNGRPDYNLLRAPKEGVSTSRNAMGRFGPPPFADSALVVGPGVHRHPVRITYLFD